MSRIASRLASSVFVTALTLLIVSVFPLTASAAAGDQTATLALKPLTNGDATFNALWIFFGKNDDLNTRGVVSAAMTVKRTINNKVETSVVNGSVSNTNKAKLQFDTSNFACSDKVANFEPGDTISVTVTLKGKDKVTVTNAGIFNNTTSDLKSLFRQMGLNSI